MQPLQSSFDIIRRGNIPVIDLTQPMEEAQQPIQAPVQSIPNPNPNPNPNPSPSPSPSPIRYRLPDGNIQARIQRLVQNQVQYMAIQQQQFQQQQIQQQQQAQQTAAMKDHELKTLRQRNIAQRRIIDEQAKEMQDIQTELLTIRSTIPFFEKNGEDLMKAGARLGQGNRFGFHLQVIGTNLKLTAKTINDTTNVSINRIEQVQRTRNQSKALLMPYNRQRDYEPPQPFQFNFPDL